MDSTMKRMEGKVALVTGATGGIGQATSLRLAQEGAKLVLVARDAEKAMELEAKVKALGTDAHVVLEDLSSEAGNANMVSKAISKFGKLDAAFLAAGVLKMAPLVEATEETFNTVFNANVGSVVFGLKALIPAMKEAGGSIVVVASVTGSTANSRNAGNGIYSASKSAALMLTKYGAIEGAPSVRVNSISPGITRTPMTEAFGPIDEIAKHVHLVPRAGKSEEIASLAAYLASDESAFVTGSDYVIDGGEALVN